MDKKMDAKTKDTKVEQPKPREHNHAPARRAQEHLIHWKAKRQIKS